MKFFRLTLTIVRSFIRYHFWEFFLFYTGMILSFLLFIFFSGNKIAQQYDSFRQTNLKRMYSYSLENGQSLSAIAEDLCGYGGKDVKNLVFSASAEVAEKNAAYPLTYTVKSWYHGNEIAEKYIYSGRYWSEDEETTGANVCLCKNGVGVSSGNVSINGKDYRVIGSAATGDLVTQILMPFTTFEKADFKNITLFFLPNEGVSESRAETINEYILSSCKVLSSEPPEIKAEWFVFSDYLEEMAEPLLIMVFAIISYLFVYSYILRKRAVWYAVFRMNGGSTALIAAVTVLELFLYSSTAFVLSCVISYFLGAALGLNTGLFTARFISVNLFIFGFVFFVSLILTIPVIRGIMKTSGLAIYGKAG